MVVHILKNGKQVKDIKGLKVTKDKNPAFYQIAERVKRGKPHERSS